MSLKNKVLRGFRVSLRFLGLDVTRYRQDQGPLGIEKDVIAIYKMSNHIL